MPVPVTGVRRRGRPRLRCRPPRRDGHSGRPAKSPGPSCAVGAERPRLHPWPRLFRRATARPRLGIPAGLRTATPGMETSSGSFRVVLRQFVICSSTFAHQRSRETTYETSARRKSRWMDGNIQAETESSTTSALRATRRRIRARSPGSRARRSIVARTSRPRPSCRRASARESPRRAHARLASRPATRASGSGCAFPRQIVPDVLAVRLVGDQVQDVVLDLEGDAEEGREAAQAGDRRPRLQRRSAPIAGGAMNVYQQVFFRPCRR